jgi:uncharacterized integral membrane protein
MLIKSVINLLITGIVAVWVVAIALISVQNATPVSLRFFVFKSIQIPFGLMLALSVAMGLIGMALMQSLWGLADWVRGRSSDEDAEFFADDEDF